MVFYVYGIYGIHIEQNSSYYQVVSLISEMINN